MALPTVGSVFCVFRIFVKKFVIHFLSRKNDPQRKSGSGQHIYTIQAIILIRLLVLSGVLKLCASFADKYI